MIKKIEVVFTQIMESSDEAYIMGQTIKLTNIILEELLNNESYLLPNITERLEKKKIIALYSRVNKILNNFLNTYQPALEEELHNIEELELQLEQNKLDLDKKKQELEDSLSHLKTDNQTLLLDEGKLIKQKEHLCSCQTEQRELELEEQSILGEDGKVLESIKERQKNYQKQINKIKKETVYQKEVLEILKQLFVRETKDQMISNVTEILQQFNSDEQFKNNDMAVNKNITNVLEDIQENIAAYTGLAQEENVLHERYEIYRKNWGEESDLMIKLEKLDIESEDKIDTYISKFQTAMETYLQEYDAILGSIVMQKAQEIELIEHRQNKR